MVSISKISVIRINDDDNKTITKPTTGTQSDTLLRQVARVILYAQYQGVFIIGQRPTLFNNCILSTSFSAGRCAFGPAFLKILSFDDTMLEAIWKP